MLQATRADKPCRRGHADAQVQCTLEALGKQHAALSTQPCASAPKLQTAAHRYQLEHIKLATVCGSSKDAVAHGSAEGHAHHLAFFCGGGVAPSEVAADGGAAAADAAALLRLRPPSPLAAPPLPAPFAPPAFRGALASSISFSISRISVSQRRASSVGVRDLKNQSKRKRHDLRTCAACAGAKLRAQVGEA